MAFTLDLGTFPQIIESDWIALLHQRDVDKIRRLIQLAAKEIRLDAVYLFGSTANGTSHEGSDIDAAIVSPDFSGDSFEDSKKLYPTILQVDAAIEVHQKTDLHL